MDWETIRIFGRAHWNEFVVLWSAFTLWAMFTMVKQDLSRTICRDQHSCCDKLTTLRTQVKNIAESPQEDVGGVDFQNGDFQGREEFLDSCRAYYKARLQDALDGKVQEIGHQSGEA